MIKHDTRHQNRINTTQPQNDRIVTARIAATYVNSYLLQVMTTELEILSFCCVIIIYAVPDYGA